MTNATKLGSLSIGLVICTMTSASAGITHAGDHKMRGAACGGLRGAEHALCVVYCETLRCGSHPRRACQAVAQAYHRLTKGRDLPCDAACGDGVVDTDEDCDGGMCADGQACNVDCTCPPPTCGNGVLDPGEGCDVADGGVCADGQACNADCTCPPPTCGNGMLDPAEACDVGGVSCPGGGPCNPDCTCTPVCGNGVLEESESCDPPGGACVPGGVCSSDCTCRGHHPECQGAVCGSLMPCENSGGCGLPICGTTAEGGGVCLDGETECDDLPACTSSAECVAGGVCVVGSCCGVPVCVPAFGICGLQ